MPTFFYGCSVPDPAVHSLSWKSGHQLLGPDLTASAMRMVRPVVVGRGVVVGGVAAEEAEGAARGRTESMLLRMVRKGAREGDAAFLP